MVFPIRQESYTGQFRDDKFNGEGTRSWGDGSEYVGQWSKGIKHGRGKFTDKDQMVYEGQWEDGRKNGNGTQTYVNGDHYKGGWFRGVQSGPGVYTFKDGRVYAGSWAMGRYDGAGILHRPDGVNERHVYKANVLQARYVMVTGAEKDRSGVVRKDRLGRKKQEVKQTRDAMTKDTLFPQLPISEHLCEAPGLAQALEECGGLEAMDQLTDEEAEAIMAKWQADVTGHLDEASLGEYPLPDRIGGSRKPQQRPDTRTPSTTCGPSPGAWSGQNEETPSPDRWVGSFRAGTADPDPSPSFAENGRTESSLGHTGPTPGSSKVGGLDGAQERPGTSIY